MKKVIIAVILIFSIAFANSKGFPKIGIPAQYSSLAKKTSSNLALTSYSSAWFNIQYTCPTGWTITDTTNTSNMFMELTVSSPNYLATIYIFAAKTNTINEATYLGGFECFEIAQTAFNASYPYMPGIYSAVDTLENGIRYKNIEVKENSSAGYTNIGLAWTESQDSSCIEFEYFTFISDYTTNLNLYLQHWKNVSFYSPTSLSKQQGVNAFATIKPNLLKENGVNLLGRTAPNFNASQMIVEPNGLLKQVIKK